MRINNLRRLLLLSLVLLASEPLGERIYPVVYAQENNSIPIQTIFLEAEGEGIGMTAVGEVIRNRAKNTGDSFTDVCMKKHQFSCYNPGKEALITKSRLSRMTGADWQMAAKAWEESKHSNWVKDATLYANLEQCTPRWDWSKTRKVTKIGKHTFWREIK